MANRTEIVCLCEGTRGGSVDAVFINRVIRDLKPSWIRETSSNFIRIEPQGGRKMLIAAMPSELKRCLAQGGHTTLMVWADMDDDMANGEQLKSEFWKYSKAAGITQEQFDQVVFIFAKDRLENWIEYLLHGSTNENIEGARANNNREVREAAATLAKRCRQNQPEPALPESLQWSCRNWKQLVERMKNS